MLYHKVMNCNNYIKDTCPGCPQRCPEMLEFISLPAILGDDSEGSNIKPENGAYQNKIVRYEYNGHIYIYDSKGIPVRMVSASDGSAPSPSFTPSIRVKTNTRDTYILTIINKDGSFDTPNLRGGGGQVQPEIPFEVESITFNLADQSESGGSVGSDLENLYLNYDGEEPDLYIEGDNLISNYDIPVHIDERGHAILTY